MELSSTELQQSHTWLLIGALFFAMRSCEYLRTSSKENIKRTKILRLKNIRFKKNGVVLDQDSKQLKCADIVIITFEFQKNNIRNRTVHMFSTGDKLLCPVVAWATIVQIILNTKNLGNDRFVFDDSHLINYKSMCLDMLTYPTL